LKALGTAALAAVLSVVATLWVTPVEPPRQSSEPAPGWATAESDAAIQRALAQRSGEGMSVVRQLCAPEYAGRKAGTPGADRAAGWLAGEMKRYGLEAPPGAAEHQQRFTMPVSLIASRWDRKAKLIGRAPPQPPGVGQSHSGPVLRRPTALIEYPCFRGGGFSIEAEAVFAGWGISRRDQGWDDYQGPDVRGKYVVYWEGAPGPGLDREAHARWRDAKDRGALGCLVLSHRPEEAPSGLESPIRDFPVLRLDPATAGRVLSGPVPPPGTRSGRPLAPLRIEIPRAADPARPVANVIGMIRGSDPEVADEAVILSAHYDHLGGPQAGTRLPSAIFPGADDDASGVAVVLGVARALRAAGARPRRSILFCLWTAEECGLLGSRAYVARPLLPLEKTRFMLQVEMVGAGCADRFETSAASLAGGGRAALQSAADHLGLTLTGDGCRGVSDHLPFTRRGVPALVVTAAGEHPDYHTPRDTPDRLKPAGIANATRLCALTLWQQANSE
jgi:hypothetical protein